VIERQGEEASWSNSARACGCWKRSKRRTARSAAFMADRAGGSTVSFSVHVGRIVRPTRDLNNHPHRVRREEGSTPLSAASRETTRSTCPDPS
jgi:hypothetical protein